MGLLHQFLPPSLRPLRDDMVVFGRAMPVFSRGGYAQVQGPRGKVIDFRTPLEIGATRVSPGDILFGDRDGVRVIPREAETEAFQRALEKVRGEQRVRKALEAVESDSGAFARFEIM